MKKIPLATTLLLAFAALASAEEAFDGRFLIAFRGVGDADLELHSFSVDA